MSTRRYDVCIITTIHRDFDNRIYQRQLDALAESGLSVCLVAPWDFSRRTRSDFDFIQTTMPRKRSARIIHGYRTYRAALSVPARMYIFHDPDFLLFGAALKWRTGKRVVYDCHENIPEDILHGKDWIPRFLRPPVSRAFRAMEDSVVKYLGQAIVVVPHLVRRFSRLGVRVVLVRNFANFSVPEDFSNDAAVLYSGSLSRDYGAYVLLDIARELKRRNSRITLRIVDRFRLNEELRAYFMRVVTEEGLAIEFLEPVQAKDMPSILQKGTIGLSPTLDSPNKALAYPTKIFEYFAFGLAVIASDVGASAEILRGGRLGLLIEAEDHEAWADAIEKLFDDEEERLAFVRAGRQAVRDEYSWTREKGQLLAFVNESISADEARLVNNA